MSVMTEVDALKTNELLRRRKLRIQQVREQSKDIAKKIRERASAEKLRHEVNRDVSKERIYFEEQDKLIRKLEELHAKSIERLGASHKNAAESVQKENKPLRVDLTKQRARNAALQLRRQQQEKLDERKKLLDRKLQAREIANEISREQTIAIASKYSKISFKTAEQQGNDPAEKIEDKLMTEVEAVQSTEVESQPTPTMQMVQDDDNPDPVTNDGVTLLDPESLKDCEAHIPVLPLPKDINSKDSLLKTPQTQSDNSARPNLFALSDDMPSSLRGGLGGSLDANKTIYPAKSSLTLVSEYIQNRDLRLRDFSPKSAKKQDLDLEQLKQTILRARAGTGEDSFLDSVHVADGHVVPVPSWQAEVDCGFHTQQGSHKKSQIEQYKNAYTKANCIKKIDTIFFSKPYLTPSSKESSTPSMKKRICPGTFSGRSNKAVGSKSKLESSQNICSKKSSVTMYDHLTRDVKDLPPEGRKLVCRDSQTDMDAYCQAVQESSHEIFDKNKQHHKKALAMRNRIAMSKENVEKQFKDTMAFLSSLPKDKSKPIKNAYKDAQQEQTHKENRQRKLQHEFRKIETECRKRSVSPENARSRSCSKHRIVRVQDLDNSDEDFDVKDMQYSWMPVPENDSLAVHIIPTKVQERKSGNNVKFSKIDSYHEYRSRHKHTPPTKDNNQEVQTPANATSSDVSSDDNATPKKHPSESTDDHSDSDNILICKILNSDIRKKSIRQKNKNTKANHKSIYSDSQNISVNTADISEKIVNNNNVQANSSTALAESQATPRPQQMKEGIYEAVNQKGENMSSSRCGETQHIPRPQAGNSSRPQAGDVHNSRKINHSPVPNSESTESFAPALEQDPSENSLKNKIEGVTDFPIKIVDQNGQDSGQFYIGASGYLKNNDYEVIIQLKKSDPTKNCDKASQSKPEETQRFNKGESTDNVLLYDNQQNSAQEKVKEIAPTTNGTNSNLQHSAEPTVASVNLVDNPPAVQPVKKNVLDKSVDCIPLSGITTEVKVNSVSVQTTSSPEVRYNRMSSSTSTTYMSPPEVILPKFMKRDNYERTSGKQKEIKTKKNTRSRLEPTDLTPVSSYAGVDKWNGCSRTPPNTARSSCKNKHHKYVKRSCSKKPVKISTKRNINKLSNTSRVRNSGRSCTTSNSHAPHPSRRESSVKNSYRNIRDSKYFNPIVKWYVDKLLTMNKEGVKAIDVVNQECSSVTTPGSSIIGESNNNDIGKACVRPVISLEQLRQMILQDALETELKARRDCVVIGDKTCNRSNTSSASLYCTKRKHVHKVKSLNISKKLFPKKKENKTAHVIPSESVSGSSTRSSMECHKPSSVSSTSSKRSTTDNTRKTTLPENNGSSDTQKTDLPENYYANCLNEIFRRNKHPSKKNVETSDVDNNVTSSQSNETCWNSAPEPSKEQARGQSLSTSTQTVCNKDEQIHFIKLAEDKLQNMEKIADLTEKCTKRLSNLAKVLHEVRRNKLSYSQEADTLSDVEQISGKPSESTTYEPIIEMKEKEFLIPSLSNQSPEPIKSPTYLQFTRETPSPKTHKAYKKNVSDNIKRSPKYKTSKSPNGTAKSPNGTANSTKLANSNIPIKKKTDGNISTEIQNTKSRAKPPPALARRLKHTQDYVIPHELSTVVEVDSPINMKSIKSARNNTDNLDLEFSKSGKHGKSDETPVSVEIKNPDLIEDNAMERKELGETNSLIPHDDSKMEIVDLNQFNNIMLKPFISIQEFAKQCNIKNLEESNLDATQLTKPHLTNDELSSLHSDGSLPDVVAELLKRNLISEPFKFDTVSNVDSITASSDSTLSNLVQSKEGKVTRESKEKLAPNRIMEESSDTLSISSNPDLENAFKKLGMGWASSTLKKTKEHLAFSSSSTDSSSCSLSQSQCKLKVARNDSPALVHDSLSATNSAFNIQRHHIIAAPLTVLGITKTNTALQSNLTRKSLTAKNFLTKELAKRITFGEKSCKNDTKEEFISMYETKIPEDMQRSKCADRSADSNSRARTSTPVQIFKSSTCRSSSSSNISNGLFSNVDDLSSVKGTSNSLRNHSTSEKDDLTVPDLKLRPRKGISDGSKSDE